MVVEDVETPNGWPLGLGNINKRLRAAQSTQVAAAAAAYSIELPFPSFSSFSSSNLDTESTASFFGDQSVSLGRLIGIRPGNKGSLPYQSTIHLDRSLSAQRSHSQVSRTTHGHGGEQTSQGLCVPLFHNVIEKMSRSKSSSRH